VLRRRVIIALRWIVAILLLYGSYRHLELAFGYWWGADYFKHAGKSEIIIAPWVSRGNLFFTLACLFLIASILLIVKNIRSGRSNIDRQ
jgi:hypothetical protein